MTSEQGNKSVSKYLVFQEYMKRARSFLNMGHIIDNDENEFWGSAFLYSISLELGCKSFLLYQKGEEYEHLPFAEQKNKINKLAKGKNHSLSYMLEEIQKISLLKEIEDLLIKQYRKLPDHTITGTKIVKILEYCYLEIRYPMPSSIIDSYPISGEDGSFYDVTIDPNLRYFVAEMLDKIQAEIDYKEKRRKQEKIGMFPKGHPNTM